MSQYLKYILKRASIPLPRKITVLRFEQEWANRQIVDELKSAFNGVEVSVISRVELPMPEFIVLPYMDEFMSEVPGGVDLYRQLRSEKSSWVMTYGLRYRKIDVMASGELFFYHNCCRKTLLYYNLLHRFHLTSFIAWLLSLRIQL